MQSRRRPQRRCNADRSLSGRDALMMSRIQRNTDETLRRSIAPRLSEYLDREVTSPGERNEHLSSRPDLHVGQRFRSGTHVMEEGEMKTSPPEFDPQPFPGRNRGRPRASLKGWRRAAGIRLRRHAFAGTGGLSAANGLSGLAAEVAWPRPTRPGDSLYVDRGNSRHGLCDEKPNQE